jgi:prophage regulatory protein
MYGQVDGQAERLRKIAERKRAEASEAGAARDPYHRAGTGPRMLIFDELKSVKGIPFSPQWISKLVRDGLFPKPIKLGLGNVNTWIEEEIDDWIAAKAAERETEAA